MSTVNRRMSGHHPQGIEGITDSDASIMIMVLERDLRDEYPRSSRAPNGFHLVPFSPHPPLAGLSPPGAHPELCRVRPEPRPGPCGRLADESDARGAAAEPTQQVRRSELRRALALALAVRVGLRHRGKQDPASRQALRSEFEAEKFGWDPTKGQAGMDHFRCWGGLAAAELQRSMGCPLGCSQD